MPHGSTRTASDTGPLSADGLDALVSELLALTKRELDRSEG